MSDNKKYYYLKLKEDFFQSDEVLFLENMPEGYKYSNILLKLYLKSLKNNGKLMMNNIIPYNAEMLATITRHSVGDVKQAIQIFNQLGLVEQLDNGAIYMLQIQNFIGKSSTEGDRKRAYRKQIEQEKGQMLNGKRQKSGHLSDNRPPELELESESESDKELKLDIESRVRVIDVNDHTPTKISDLSTDISTELCTNNSQLREEVKEILKPYNINIDDIHIISLKLEKRLSEGLKADKEYLQEKIDFMKFEKKDIKENFGYLIKAVSEDWTRSKRPFKKESDNVKKKQFKTKFHNFDQSSSEQYSDEALNALLRGRNRR